MSKTQGEALPANTVACSSALQPKPASLVPASPSCQGFLAQRAGGGGRWPWPPTGINLQVLEAQGLRLVRLVLPSSSAVQTKWTPASQKAIRSRVLRPPPAPSSNPVITDGLGEGTQLSMATGRRLGDLGPWPFTTWDGRVSVC